jgi:rod shape-determining protein MreD
VGIANIPSLGSLAPIRSGRSPTRALVGVGLALLAGALVQTSATLYLPSAVPRPDLVLVVALAWGFLRGSGEGFLAAVAGGLLLDCQGTAPFGLHVLAFGLAALVVSGDGAFSTSALRRSTGAVVAAAIVHLLMLAVLQMRGWEPLWPVALVRGTLPALAADAALLPVCYALLRRLPEPAAEPLVGGS